MPNYTKAPAKSPELCQQSGGSLWEPLSYFWCGELKHRRWFTIAVIKRRISWRTTSFQAKIARRSAKEIGPVRLTHLKSLRGNGLRNKRLELSTGSGAVHNAALRQEFLGHRNLTGSFYPEQSFILVEKLYGEGRESATSGRKIPAQKGETLSSRPIYYDRSVANLA